MFIRVCLFGRSFDDYWFTYKIPSNITWIKPWIPIFVPFWEEILLWVVLEKLESITFTWDIRDIHSLAFDKPILLPWQIEILQELSSNNFILIHNVLSLFVPKNMRDKLNKWKFALKDFEMSYSYNNSKTLTKDQSEVLKKLEQKGKYLLHWVTGSWKTEVYVNVVKNNVDNGLQTLLMVPEIILTNQVLEYVNNVFWDDVIVLNSAVTEATKTKNWIKIYNWQAKIIVWTRSSLFYPYQNLWAIIIDEEHDDSYISSDTPRYDSIEIASKIAEIKGALLLLWSGTPKVEHMFRALKWEFELIQLLKEIGS